MRTITNLDQLASARSPIVLAAGAFDGVHLGHREVISQAQGLARDAKGEAWVMTFDPHPLKILRPESAPALLTSTPHKLQLLHGLGVDGCAVLPFTHHFAAIEPEPFLRDLRRAVPTLRAMVVGSNWTFGHRARGTSDLLRRFGRENGFDVRIVDGVAWQGEPVSSTRIRRAVAEGRLDEATAMLGRPFSMYGTVIHGTKMGRQLGYPTANVDPHNEVRPPPGIYAVRATVEGATYAGAAFLTAHPDPRKGPPDVVEVHLIDQNLDLYDRDMDVAFVRHLRAEWTFNNLDALKTQIAVDIAQARAALHWVV